jgi:hypothetical protein
MSGLASKRSSVGADISVPAKKKKAVYSDIPASDIVDRFGKEKLIGRCKLLIHRNMARIALLEARDLIDSPRRDSIEAKLNLGQSVLAATELADHLSDSLDGEKMAEFCDFVENQAGKSSVQLLKFAKELRDCIVYLASTNQTVLTESVVSPAPTLTTHPSNEQVLPKASVLPEPPTSLPDPATSELAEVSLPPLVEFLLNNEDLLEKLYPADGGSSEESEVADVGTNSDVYPMTKYPRGPAIIISNENFITMDGRPGTARDMNALKHLFTNSGFETTTHTDLTAAEMKQTLKTLAGRNLTKAQCVVVAILTHGGEGGILYGVDGKGVKVEELANLFAGKNCRSLAGKPKLFFIQACRGVNRDRGVEECEADGISSPVPEPVKSTGTDVADEAKTLPSHADFLFSYSTIEGYAAFRNTVNGSWYIRDLIDVFSKDASKEHLTDMLTKVNQKISERKTAKGYKQTSSKEDSLRKKLFFPPAEEHLVDHPSPRGCVVS